MIKIVTENVNTKDQLQNVSIPANTIFKSETYFADTKNSPTGIYKDIEGKIRTRALAPIFYNSGSFKKYVIAGGVVVETVAGLVSFRCKFSKEKNNILHLGES